MQKIFLLLLFILISKKESKAQQKLFDQAVQLKSCNISIDANSFIATTIVEMEFYNPKEQEVEGYRGFELKRGQVITNFQLELNGKYREGSIEERWKANRAYSAIVGKKIDPAILQMNWQNQYSIRIYPIAAKSSRKIKFTITQMMEEENSKLIYNLPLKFVDNTADFSLDIKINTPASIPYVNKGLLENQLFDMNINAALLSWQAKNIILNKPISFSINQFTEQPQICVTRDNDKSHFLMRVYPTVSKYYLTKPKSINVYWDVSLSGKERNLKKELDFLEKYISENQIDKTSIILFNQELQGVIVFNREKDSFNTIHYYLLNYEYAGATELGNLNFNNVLADAVLLFSDGINSIGKAQPKLGTVPVYCIVSSYIYPNNYNYFSNYNKLYSIAGSTGGSIIDLYSTAVKDAVNRIDTVENFLFKYNAKNVRINEGFPIKLSSSILLSGTIDRQENLELIYGNNSVLYRSVNYFLTPGENCDDVSYKKMRMLKAYDSLMYGNERYYGWQNMIIFGLTEKVVTPQTSFLVLERIEDYIKYNIAPPKELEEKCAEMNYVYRSEYKIAALKTFTEQDALESVVNVYNKRITWWDKNEILIDLSKPLSNSKNIASTENSTHAKNDFITSSSALQTDFNGATGNLKEVVVSGGYGVRRSLKISTTNTQFIYSEQLNTIRNTNINEALAGKVAGIQLRGQSGAKLSSTGAIRLHGVNSLSGSTGILYVLDGTRVAADDINTDDIEDVTLLQGPAAAAIFGPDGSNGAFVVTSKKAKRSYGYSTTWTAYKLSSIEDADYMQEIAKALSSERWDKYLELAIGNDRNISFHFEMADYFFEKGDRKHAHQILYTAIELCKGSTHGLMLTAYIYEKWKDFDKAIKVYKGLLSTDENNILIKRNLALAYFQNKNYETSVKTYYSIITAPVSEDSYNNIKEIALTEMNAIITMHRNNFDFPYINQNLVRSLPVDLRMTVESNYIRTNLLQITEPKKAICSYINENTVNGGRLLNNYWNGNGVSEYAIKDAVKGRYGIKVNAYNYGYSHLGNIPMFIRVVVFKNFQKENMEMEVKLFDLDNQYGIVELDEVHW